MAQQTPKERAKQLVDQYEHSTYSQVQGELAKQCALIAVDEIIKANPTELLTDPYEFYSSKGHWEQVKQEIEKL